MKLDIEKKSRKTEATHEAPALAILDVVMPKMGGRAAAGKLAEQFSKIQVLFTSGYSPESTEVPADETNKPRYLQKPYRPTTLGRLVRETLDRQPK